MTDAKRDVREFWDTASCGEIYAIGNDLRSRLDAQAQERYRLEPYLEEFARFNEVHGEDVLEIGVGMGADHVRLASACPRSITGVDLTPRAVDWTQTRMAAYGLTANLHIADAEQLPFGDRSFSLVYSWGVLHHSPDTQAAVDEVHRVLRPGGRARVMVYHTHSLVGYILWVKYALCRGRVTMSLSDVYANHLESPGTKAFTEEEVQHMFRDFSSVETHVQLSFGDLLQGEVGLRHGGLMLRIAKRLWPRRIIGRFFSKHGLFLLVDAVK